MTRARHRPQRRLPRSLHVSASLPSTGTVAESRHTRQTNTMNSAITPPFLFSPHVRCQYVSLPVATHPGTSKNLGQYSENYMSSTPRSGVENSFIALDIVPMETRLLGVYTVSEAFPEDRYSGMGALIPTETLQVVHISTAIHRSTVARARSEDALASVDTGDGPPGSRAEPGWA